MSCLCVLTNITYQDIFIFPEIHIVTLFMVYVILQHFNDFTIEKYNAGFAFVWTQPQQCNWHAGTYTLGWVEMIRSAEIIVSHPKENVIHKNNHNSENVFYLEPPYLAELTKWWSKEKWCTLSK